MIGLLWLALGAVMLVTGAELFAENVTAAARRVGLTGLALGVLLAGAEPEEALTAGIASGRGHPLLAAGDAIGANFVVMTLALGLAAVLATLPVSRRVCEYAVAAVLAGLLVLVTMLDGRVDRLEGGLLVAVYAVAVAWVWRRERRPPDVGEVAEAREHDDLLADRTADGTADRGEEPPSGLALALVLGGALLMVGGGWLAVIGAEHVVNGLGLDDTGVGLTLLALATSAEMLALVLAAARHRVAEVALAGLVGAVAYNATVSVGVGALVRPLTGVGGGRLLLVAGVCAVLPLVVLLLRRFPEVRRWTGAALVAGYLVAVPVLLA